MGNSPGHQEQQVQVYFFQKLIYELQCDDSIDSNIAHHYYANIKKKFKIPALWVLLKFLGQVPIGKNFNFLDIKNRYLAPCASQQFGSEKRHHLKFDFEGRPFSQLNCNEQMGERYGKFVILFTYIPILRLRTQCSFENYDNTFEFFAINVTKPSGLSEKMTPSIRSRMQYKAASKTNYF